MGHRSIDSGISYLNYLFRQELRRLKANNKTGRGFDPSPSYHQQGGAKKRRKWAAIQKMLASANSLRGSGSRGKRGSRYGKGPLVKGGKRKRKGGKRRRGGKRRTKKGGRRTKKGGRRGKFKRAGRSKKGGAKRRLRKRKVQFASVEGPKNEIRSIPTPASRAGSHLGVTGSALRTLASRQFSMKKRSGLQPMSSLEMFKERL